MFVEGEEEIGSPSLSAFLREHLDDLRSDVIVIADSGNWDIGVPVSPPACAASCRRRQVRTSAMPCTPAWAPVPTR
jgi:hypothetical protein